MIRTGMAGFALDGADVGDTVAARVADARVVLQAFAGAWEGAALTPATATRGGVYGAVPAATGVTAGAPSLTATLAVSALTPDGLARALQALAALAPAGADVAVTCDLVPDRRWRGQRTAWATAPQGPTPAKATWALATLTVQPIPPAAESVARRVVVVSSVDAGPTALPIGSLPVWPRIVLTPGATGAVTDPVLTLTDLAGAVVATFALTGSLAAGQWWELDMARRGIWTEAGAFAGDLRTAGDYFALDPDDGDRATGAGPALRVTVGSGSARAVVDYLPRWDV